MIAILFATIIISTIFFTITYQKNNVLSQNHGVLIGLGIVASISIILICNYFDSVRLLFNIRNPDIDFSQTISSDYITSFVIMLIKATIIFGIYLFANHKLRIKSYWFLVAILVFSVAFYYPGVDSADGSNSYNQYLMQNYDDWQPPMFTIWWLIFRFYGSTFLINMITYYGGLIYISYYLDKKGLNWQNHLLILFSLNPLLITQLVIIWKDISFTAYLIDLVAIYLALENINNKRIRILLWIIYFMLAFLTIAFRINGMFAVIPFIYIALNKFQFKQSKLVDVTIKSLSTICIIFAMVILNSLIVHNIMSAKKSYAQEFTMLSDTAYVSCMANNNSNNISEFFANPTFSDSDTICDQALNYYNFDALFNDWNNWGVPYKAPLKTIATPEANKIAQREWINTITDNPLTYLEYRAQFFLNILFNQYWYPSDSNGVIKSKLNEISDAQHHDMKIILPLILIISTIFVITYMILNRSFFNIVGVIMISNLLQLIGWYFLIPAHAARYFFWNDIAAIIAIILIPYKVTKIDKTPNVNKKNKFLKNK